MSPNIDRVHAGRLLVHPGRRGVQSDALIGIEDGRIAIRNVRRDGHEIHENDREGASEHPGPI